MSERSIERLEHICMRQLTMETSLVNNIQKCHTQEKSPLYSTLPKEIRDLVFGFVCNQYEDLTKPYKKTTWYYRPGYRGPLKSSTSLLLTCRRVWLETSQLPALKAKHTLWFETNRGPPIEDLPRYNFRSLTKLNKDSIRTVQIFAQKHMLDRMFFGSRMNWENTDIVVKELRVTMRHTDWNRWEDPEPLVLDQGWILRILNSPYLSTLETFQLELESLEQYANQLESIVDRVETLIADARPGADGSTAATQFKFNGTHYWHWEGQPNINDEIQRAHDGMEKLCYRVAVLTWKAVPCAEPLTISAVASTGPAPLFNARRILRPPGPRPPFMGDVHIRRHLSQDGWQSMQFPFAQYLVSKQSRTTAAGEEDRRASSFKKMFADVKTRELAAEWKAKGSLLKLVE